MDKNNDNFLNTQLGLNPYLFHKLVTCLYEKLNSSTTVVKIFDSSQKYRKLEMLESLHC